MRIIHNCSPIKPTTVPAARNIKLTILPIIPGKAAALFDANDFNQSPAQIFKHPIDCFCLFNSIVKRIFMAT